MGSGVGTGFGAGGWARTHGPTSGTGVAAGVGGPPAFTTAGAGALGSTIQLTGWIGSTVNSGGVPRALAGSSARFRAFHSSSIFR